MLKALVAGARSWPPRHRRTGRRAVDARPGSPCHERVHACRRRATRSSRVRPCSCMSASTAAPPGALRRSRRRPCPRSSPFAFRTESSTPAPRVPACSSAMTWGRRGSAFNQGLVGGILDSQLDISALEVRGDSLYAGTFGAGVYVRGLSGVSTWSHFGEEFEPNQMSNVNDVVALGERA